MEATGVPEALFRNPNFAEAVLVPPTRRSAVFENGETAPLFNCHKLLPAAQALQVGAPPAVEVKHWPVVPAVVCATVPVPLVYKTPPAVVRLLICISPLFLMVNLLAPLLLAVKRSPVPD